MVDVKEEGYNEAISKAANEVAGLKNTIYKAGYEYGLTCAGLQNYYKLFGKVVLCPPGAFTLPAPSATLEEDAE